MVELWRIAPGQQLAAWRWDDECVVYNSLSGDTHLLDNDSMDLLERLREAPGTIDALTDAFSEGLDQDDAQALPVTLANLLAQLKTLFLVDSVVVPC